jgi:hypothetical protein
MCDSCQELMVNGVRCRETAPGRLEGPSRQVLRVRG